MKIIQTFRKHPKKSIVFGALGAYGVKYFKDKYDEEQLLAAYCKAAAEYGEQRHPVAAPHRHITVLLNPAAAGGKCKAQFERYCAPLLHLAGLKVAVVRTEHQGQARELMQIMEKTDGVVVAGGDGTLSEVLTGLLRRDDNAAARLPLSVLPLGSSSAAGRAVWGVTGSPQPQHLLEATMAVVRQVLAPMDVMEVTPHPREGAETPKPIYASLLEWGAYREAWERRDVYWYYATFRRYATYLFSSYKDLSWDCSSSIEYTKPCSGCSKCRCPAPSPTEPQTAPADTGPPKRWYQYLLPSMRSATRQNNTATKDSLLPPEPQVDYSSISNPECGEVHQSELERVSDVLVSGRNTATTRHLHPYQLLLRAGPPDITAKEFISEGWRRCWSGTAGQHETEILAGSVTITPTGPLKNDKGEDREFYLDGEEYEVRAVTLRPIPRAVTIFAPPPAPPTAPAAQLQVDANEDR